MEETIKNYDSYTSGMKKSSADKLFWMSKIEKINTVVDFGCADGTLIREMNSEMPDLQYIGYDNNKAMISLAGIRTPHELENIQYVSDLKESLKENNQNKDKHFNFRVNEKEYNKIKSKIKKSKLNTSEYLLKTAMDKEIIVINGLEEAITQLRKIGNNINQLTKLSNQGSITNVNLENVKEELKNIWQLLNLLTPNQL